MNDLPYFYLVKFNDVCLLIVKVADKIEGYDADYIAGEGGLVYLRGIIADCLTDPPPEYAPDTMPVSEGVLVFGGKGSKRWW